MRSQPLRIAVLCSLIVVCTAFLYSQVTSPITFKAPEKFICDNTTLPPGTYRISPEAMTEPNIFELSSTNGDHSVLFEARPTISPTPVTKTEVEFWKYGNELMLKSFFINGNQTGATVTESLREKMAKKAGTKPVKQRVEATKG
jgi:hypothetical protein